MCPEWQWPLYILDETAPIVAITFPTQDTSYKTTIGTITLRGGASDVTSGVKTVTWSSNKGGSGTATGTTSWTISNISLSVEDNEITVTATDNAGNTATDVLTVKYTVSTPTPSPTPAVTPSPMPQASPSPTPRTSPSPTPVVTPTPLPSLTPTPTPQSSLPPTPQTSPTPTPAQSPLPIVTPTQQPTPQTVPSPTPPAAETPVPSPTLATTPKPRTTSTPKDTEVPIGSISIQGGASYTNLSEIALDLQATDNVGVTGYYLASGLPMPTALSSGWTPISSTTNYRDTVPYSLTGGDGSKTIYVWYKDANGNVSNTVSASLVLDTKAPKVTIISPTSGEKYKSDTGTISLGGAASDGTSGVRSITWSNNKGGSGTASGTDTWTISDITLRGNDENKITVTAVDNAGNSATDEIRVEYTATAPTPQGTPSPMPSVTLTPLPTPTATLKPTPIPSPTLKSTPQPRTTPSPGPVATPTLQPSPTATLTTTPTPEFTPSITPTPQSSPSPAEGGTLYGMVTDDDNNPLEGVAVSVKGEGISSESNTGGDGYYRFDGLSAGKYKLTYEKEGYRAQKQEVALEDSEVKALETVAMRSLRNEKGAISGHVVDTGGNPLASVELRLKGKKKKSYNGSTDEDGFFEFQDLEADTYTLIAKMRGYKRVQQRITLKKGENKEIEIEMKSTKR